MYPRPINYFFDIDSNVYLSSIITKKSGEVIASSIHPDLRISNGEVKIILEYTIFHNRNVPSQKLFGFLFYSPQYKTKEGKALTYFTSVAMFTPQGTAFSATAP